MYCPGAVVPVLWKGSVTLVGLPEEESAEDDGVVFPVVTVVAGLPALTAEVGLIEAEVAAPGAEIPAVAPVAAVAAVEVAWSGACPVVAPVSAAVEDTPAEVEQEKGGTAITTARTTPATRTMSLAHDLWLISREVIASSLPRRPWL
jgi:hypothetical protein